MKKQILHLLFLAAIALSIGACKNDTTANTSSTDETPAIGATGIASIDKLTAQITKNTSDATLFAARAKAFHDNEGYDNAILDMAKAMKIDSTNADYHHQLSEIYLDYFKSRLALQTMKRCVSLHPRRIKSLLYLAEIQQILKQYDASMSTITRVMGIEPDNPEGFYMIGLNHILMGNKTMSIKTLQKCVDIDPDHTDAWVLLGQIFKEDKDPIAEQYFENAVQSSPNDVDILFNKASYLHNTDRLDKAADILKRIIKSDKNYVNAYQSLGVIYIEKDSMQKAYENFNIAVNLDPQFGIGYYYRGYTSEMLGKLQSAKDDYQTVLNFEPNFERAKSGMERVNAALPNK